MNNKFITHDAYLASVLLSEGFVIDSMDKTNLNKVSFIFNRETALDDVIQAYWAKELKVEPQMLFANYKQIKNRIYSQ
ncbi:DUF5659 domain-containing protein [Patescibacteria group bacterium]